MSDSTNFSKLITLINSGDVINTIQCIRELKKRENVDVGSLDRIYQAKSGDSLAHIAARNGLLDVLKCLHEEIPNYNFERANLNGKRPLHEAAQASQLQCLRFLLSLNVEINCLKKADWTPLMLASTKSNIFIIQALIKAGADQLLRNKDGWTSLHIACREGHVEIVSYLMKSEPNLWNTKSKNGRTPLHTAALHGHVKVVELLLMAGEYERDEEDSCGTTPLMDAFRANHVQVASLLIQTHKADVFKTDKLGRCALHHSAQAGSLLSLKFILNSFPQVDVNIQDLSSLTPLQLAIKCLEKTRSRLNEYAIPFNNGNISTTQGITLIQETQQNKSFSHPLRSALIPA